MEIVIDIPEERFRDIQRIAEVQHELNHFKTAEQIIANGTPLPKGHGRLIDASYKVSSDGRTIDAVCGYIAPTIIEADKESEDE